jgi:chromosome segregation ATPase
MGLAGRLATLLVLGLLAVGIAFNIWVITSCEYLQSETGNTSYQFGVWRYAINDSTSEFDTGGECEDLSDLFDSNEFDWKYRTAQVCSAMAPFGGALALFVVLFSQCCCPVPLGDKLLLLGYTVANVSTSLVWLVRTNDVCDTRLGGCEWGDAAIYQLVAQIAYVLAAIFYKCLPDPKERQAERRQAKADTPAQDTEENDRDPGGVTAAGAAANAVGNDDQQQQQLQQQLDKANSQIQDLEKENEKTKTALAAATAATGTVAGAEAVQLKKFGEEKEALEKQLKTLEAENKTMSKDLQTAKSTPAEESGEGKDALESKIKDLEEQNEKTKQALAAATAVTGTAAVAEAGEIKKLKEENEALKGELDQAKNESEKTSTATSSKIQELEEENDKTKKALAAATAVTGTAAAAEALEIKKLNEQNDELREKLKRQQDMVQELNEENEKIKKSLGAATAATATTAAAEAVKIKNLQEEIQKVQEENVELKGEVDKSKEEMSKLESDIDELKDEEDKTKKALAAASTVTGTAAAAEALEIKKLNEQNDDLTEQLKRQQDMVQELNEENEIKKSLGAATAATATTAAAEAVKIKNLQEEIQKVQEENVELKGEVDKSKEEMSKLESDIDELQEEHDKTKIALAAATVAAGAAAATNESSKIQELEEQVELLMLQEEELLMEVKKSRQTEEEAADMIRKLERDNEEPKPASAATANSSRSLAEDNVQVDQEGIEVVESTSGDPPGLAERPSPALSLQEVQAENHILKAELDMVKSDYAEKLSLLEETESRIRLDLASKIDELHEKNEKRKEALELATARVSHDNKNIYELKKEKEALQDRIHLLEEENSKLTVAQVKAQLAAATTSPRSAASGDGTGVPSDEEIG